MYVCFCLGVNDKTIVDAIDSGAATIDEVTACCDAGACCGGCHDAIESLLAQHQSTTQRKLAQKPAFANS